MQPDQTVSRSKVLWTLCSAALALLLTACGGGGGGGTPPANNEQDVNGGGVKGPLANADVAFYEFDANFADFQAATAAASGTTNANAKFVGITLGSGSTAPNPPYIVVFSARDADPATNDPGTTDLTTGQPPVIRTLKTVVTQEMLDSGANIYATPLTTMAVNVAIANALSGVAPYTGTAFETNVTVDKFLAALPIAASQVRESVGFGLPATVDIFDTPPLVDEAVTDTSVAEVAEYRQAVEALSAVVYEMAKQTSSASPDAVLGELTNDLADGAIDGQTKSGSSGTTGTADATILSEASLDILNVDPATLNIPGTSTPVTDVEAVLNTEIADTGTTTTVDPTTTDAGATTVAVIDPDRDDDGVLNSEDAFPDDPNETTDTDSDGIGDNSDADIDGDGVLNDDDFAPTDNSVWVDPNVTAGGSDADADGVDDASDNCPASYNPAQADMDSDGEGDACDTDIDGDTVLNAADAFPLNAGETIDTDGDGVGNNTDADDDNDGVLDADEPAQSTDPLLADTDGDGRNDKKDKCPTDPAEWLDADNDGICNGNDADADNDGVDNTLDAFPNDPRADADTDGDGVADDVYDWDGTSRGAVNAALSDTDDDNDGLLDTVESNTGTFVDSGDTGTDPKNADSDGDGLKDNVETGTGTYVGALNTGTNPNMADTDSDGLNDSAENNSGTFVSAANTGTDPNAADTDGDGINDGAETNTATFVDASDTGTNPLVADTDSDGLNDGGEVTAGTDPFVTDTDGDGLTDGEEAGSGGTGTDPTVADSDGDSINDGAEVTAGTDPNSNDTDSDTILDNVDNCPVVANTDQADGDSNGVGDACDVDSDGDTVSDSIDNCPAVANTNQANLDGDSMGDACDADRDGDGVDNGSDAFPDDASESADSDGDGIGDNADPCPNDATDSCPATQPANANGAYSLTTAVTGHTETTEPEAGWCWSSEDEAQLNVPQDEGYTSVKVDGTTITIDRDIVGTVNPDGSFTASNTTTEDDSYWNGSSDVPMTVTWGLTLTGTVNGPDVSGTWVETSTSGSVLDCVANGTFAASKVYTPTGSEDYSSVYAMELVMEENPNGSASGVSILPFRVIHGAQFEFDAINGTVDFDDSYYVEMLASSYDPATGAFSANWLEEVGSDDRDGGGTLDDLVRYEMDVRGVFIRAPGSSQPEMWLQEVNRTEYVYYNTGSYSGQVADEVNPDVRFEGYAKMVDTVTNNRVYTNPNGNGTVNNDFLGLQHPPMKTANANSELTFEAYAGTTVSGTPLCSKPFGDMDDMGNPADSGLQFRGDLTEANGFLRPDMSTESIQSGPYVYINCKMAEGTVVTGNPYTLAVRDDNGTPLDSTDDIVTSFAHTATAVATYPGVKQDRRTLNFNGATMSSTEGGSYVIVNGFFNPYQDIPVSWPAVTGADQYALKFWNMDTDFGTKQDQQWRIVSSTNSATIKAKQGLELFDNVVAVRLQARYTDGSSNRAYSHSKHALLKPGLNGMVDVELLGAAGPMIFQMAAYTDETGAVNCKFTQTGGDDCAGPGTIDYATNTVTIPLVSGSDLVLVFSDAVNASASIGSDVGNAIVVKQELVAKTRVRPNGVQSTQIYLANPIPGYEQAGLIDGATSGATLAYALWDNTVGGALDPEGYFGKVYQFFVSDWDGVPATVGTAATYETDTTATATLADGTYKVTIAGHVAGLPDRDFKVSYAYADPTSMDPPTPPEVTINGTGGTGAQVIGGAIALGGSPITSMTWVSTSPTDSEWMVMIRGVDGTGAEIKGQDIRTSWMSTSHAGLSFDGVDTWTWTNPDGIPADIWANGQGKIILRVRPAGDGDIQGIGPALFVTP